MTKENKLPSGSKNFVLQTQILLLLEQLLLELLLRLLLLLLLLLVVVVVVVLAVVVVVESNFLRKVPTYHETFAIISPHPWWDG